MNAIYFTNGLETRVYGKWTPNEARNMPLEDKVIALNEWFKTINEPLKSQYIGWRYVGE